MIQVYDRNAEAVLVNGRFELVPESGDGCSIVLRDLTGNLLRITLSSTASRQLAVQLNTHYARLAGGLLCDVL